MIVRRWVNDLSATGCKNIVQKAFADLLLSFQVESILNPVKGVRDAQRRAGIEPVNHSRNNALAVKEQSRLNALKKLQEQEEAEQAEQNRGKPALRRTSSGGSRPTSRPGTGLQRQHSSSGRNFVEENKVTAAATCKPAKAEQRTDDPEAFLQKRDYGRVPEYLLERKMQLAEEYDAVQAAKQAALIPAGRDCMSAMLHVSVHCSDMALLRLTWQHNRRNQHSRQNQLKALKCLPVSECLPVHMCVSVFFTRSMWMHTRAEVS